MSKYKRSKFYTQEEVDNNVCNWVSKSSKFKDQTGKVFGDLTILKIHKRKKPHTYWFAKCTCGNIISTSTNLLSGGKTQCTECGFKKLAVNKAISKEVRLERVRTKMPNIMLVDAYDEGAFTEWLWYCPDCNTPFKAMPHSLDNTPNPSCRCNTTKFERWTQQTREFQIRGICTERGLSFLGWEDSYKNSTSRLFVKCPKHPHYSINVGNFTNGAGYNCPHCAEESRGDRGRHELQHFLDKAKEAHGDHFDYSNYEYICSRTPSEVKCNICGERFKVSYDNHINKRRGCPGCKGKNQKQTYLFLIEKGSTPIGIKFGKARNYEDRFKTQGKKTNYDLSVIGCWSYEDSYNCREAEKYVKSFKECGLLRKEEYPDGFSETLPLSFIDTIIQVYRDFGGEQIV
mgnify:CR=1 FL=1